jgi:hypothetical protein
MAAGHQRWRHRSEMVMGDDSGLADVRHGLWTMVGDFLIAVSRCSMRAVYITTTRARAEREGEVAAVAPTSGVRRSTGYMPMCKCSVRRASRRRCRQHAGATSSDRVWRLPNSARCGIKLVFQL